MGHIFLPYCYNQTMDCDFCKSIKYCGHNEKNSDYIIKFFKIEMNYFKHLIREPRYYGSIDSILSNFMFVKYGFWNLMQTLDNPSKCPSIYILNYEICYYTSPEFDTVGFINILYNISTFKNQKIRIPIDEFLSYMETGIINSWWDKFYRYLGYDIE